jgi:pimeloyl-ACP methyl ester carboxylesterase
MDGQPLSNWVFLRGLVRESAHWDDFPSRFAENIPGARVHLVDLPGTGKLWQQASPLTLDKIVEAVRGEALAQMGMREGQGIKPYYLLSISLGGMVAVEWAHRHPSELAGAVMINTSLRGFSPLHCRLSWRCWSLLARIVTTADIAERERLILRLTSALAEPPAELIASRVAIQRRHPVTAGNMFRQLWAAARYLPPIEKPAIPLLLLNSLGDRMVDPDCTEAIAEFWGVACKTHSWAGHDVPLDDSAWVIASVKDGLLQVF